MGAICGSLGALEGETGYETRIAIDRLERALVELQSATARIVQQSVQQNITQNIYNTTIQGAPRYAAAFAASTQWVIPASVHGFNIQDLSIMCYDAAGQWVVPDSIFVDNATKTVTVNWFTAQSGRVVIQ
jgi:hypothetical protein